METTNILEQTYSKTYVSFSNSSKQPNAHYPENTLGNFEDTTKFLEDYIIQVIKMENELTLIDKINFTRYIIFNSSFLINLNDFYEEECHLSLLNWLWKERSTIKANSNAKLLELLYNILIIFENLPIKPQDLIGLNLFEKLNKIKGYVSKAFPDISVRIQNLLNYWKKQYELVTERTFLQKKHSRFTEIDTDADSEDTVIIWKKRKIGPEKLKKAVSINLNLNNVIFFDKEEEPNQILKEKNKYDPLMIL